MKRIHLICVCTVAVVAVLLSSCGSKKQLVGETTSAAGFQPQAFLQQVDIQAPKAQCVTAKLKFSAKVGSQNISVGGSLRMKRDDVIRIQLVALGIVEAGRLEFTRDYVLFMDRINKQYVKVPYEQVDFLAQSGINFYMLQSLFWNELFQPGHRQPQLADFTVTPQGPDVAITLPEVSRIAYSWLADAATARIKTTQVDHREARMRWDYRAFKKLDNASFPTDMAVEVTTAKKRIDVGLQLSNLDTDDEWETRTAVSSKYRQVSVDDILRRIMSL